MIENSKYLNYLEKSKYLWFYMNLVIKIKGKERPNQTTKIKPASVAFDDGIGVRHTTTLGEEIAL